jgi:hypothetical protein
VPLSEHEQRLLDQIERALYAEDPKFASTVRSTDLRSHLRRRIKRMAVLLFVGFALFIGGIFVEFAVSIAGFAVMVVAGTFMARSWLKLSGRSSDTPKLHLDRPHLPREGGWKARFEERWQRRRDERDGRD